MYTSHCLFSFDYSMETVCFVKLTKKADMPLKLMPLLMTYVGEKIVKSTDFQKPVQVIINSEIGKSKTSRIENPKDLMYK